MLRRLPALAIFLVAGCSSSSGAGPTPTATPTATQSPSPTATVPPPFALRVVTGNLSSGNNQNWNAGEGRRILEGVHADVALLQEWTVGGNTDPELRAFVDTAFGATFEFAHESGAGVQLPNGIVSRWPIAASGTWTDPQVSNRAFEWAHIDLPGPVDLWAVSLHLLTSSAGNRDLEAHALLTHLQADIPPSDFLVIGGDFNTDARTEACINTLSAVVTTTGPFPVDNLANENTNGPRSKAYDWVLASPGLHAVAVTTSMASASFANGLVVDTRVYTPITDLAPALAGDSGATSMQHMAVVRDFQIP